MSSQEDKRKYWRDYYARNIEKKREYHRLKMRSYRKKERDVIVDICKSIDERRAAIDKGKG